MKHPNAPEHAVFVGIIVASMACLPTARAAESADYAGFRQTLGAIDHLAAPHATDGDWPYFENPEVRTRYRESSAHLALTRQLLRDPTASLGVKQLAIRLMQCLDLATYVDLVASTYEDVREARVAPEVLATLLFPGSEWGVLLAVNYKDRKVASLLHRIWTDGSLPAELRHDVRGLLRGEVFALLEAYDFSADVMPRLRCSTP